MSSSCLVFGKGSPYIFIELYSVKRGSEAATVVNAVRLLVSRRYSRNKGFEIDLYQSPGISMDSSVYEVEKIVDDNYLNAECTRISRDAVVEEGRCLIAVATFSTEFIVGKRVGRKITYVLQDKVHGPPEQIAKLTREWAQKVAKDFQDFQEQDILSINVYQTEKTCREIEDDPQIFVSKRFMRLLTAEGRIPVSSGDGCLFVEITVKEYFNFEFVIFRQKSGQYYTRVGTGGGREPLPQTLKVVEDRARPFIRTLDDWDSGTMSVDIFIYTTPYNTFEDLRDAQLTAEVLRSGDFVCCSTKVDLKESRFFLVIFFINVSSRRLGMIPEESDGVDRRTIASLARKRESPSTGSKLSTLLTTQRNEREDAIYNYRPHTLAGPPVQIYNSAFVTFIREMSRSYATLDFSEEELDGALDFIDASLNFYQNESYRRAELHRLQALGDLISPEINFEPKSIKPDGTLTVIEPISKQEAYVRIVEMKNEIGEGGSDPIAQAECGFVLVCSSKKYELFRSVSCCPMFLVGIAGPHLTVSGAVFAERFVSQRLTDYIYLGPLPNLQGRSALDHSIHRVAQVLRALKRATEELTGYYSGLKLTPPPTVGSHGSLHGPSSRLPSTPPYPITLHVVPPSFREYTVKDERYTVEYTSRLPPRSQSGAVFKGTVCGEDGVKHNIVIKFTPDYCKGAHEKLAEVGRAPLLRFCERVGSVGMYVVVMDYEEGVSPHALLVGEHAEQLRVAMEILNAEDYVHGDIRTPNILITGAGLKLIDFDWCGKAGVARYPADINLTSGIGWHNGVRRGGLIERGHDEHMFKLLTGHQYTATSSGFL